MNAPADDDDVEVISEGGSDRDNGRDADDVDEDDDEDDDDLTQEEEDRYISLLQHSKSVPISELFIVPGWNLTFQSLFRTCMSDGLVSHSGW